MELDDFWETKFKEEEEKKKKNRKNAKCIGTVEELGLKIDRLAGAHLFDCNGLELNFYWWAEYDSPRGKYNKVPYLPSLGVLEIKRDIEDDWGFKRDHAKLDFDATELPMGFREKAIRCFNDYEYMKRRFGESEGAYMKRIEEERKRRKK